MSAGIAINRVPPGTLSLYHERQQEHIESDEDPNFSEATRSEVTRSESSQERKSSPEPTSDLEQRLREALRERDDQWRKHEKAQIAFLQQESSNMLRGLHNEIERLGHHLKDAKHKLFVAHGDQISLCDHTDLEKKILQQQQTILLLENELKHKENQAENIETKVKATIEKLQEQITLQADRIRQLSLEMNDRNQTVAHLSSQLRTYRLRDAMATVQQRRRASQSGTTSPQEIVSPTTPYRMFPPKGLVSASVTVSYPGSRSDFSGSQESAEGPGSIERPRRRKSATGFGK